MRPQPGVCTACRVGGDGGWQVAMQTITLTQSVRYLHVRWELVGRVIVEEVMSRYRGRVRGGSSLVEH